MRAVEVAAGLIVGLCGAVAVAVMVGWAAGDTPAVWAGMLTAWLLGRLDAWAWSQARRWARGERRRLGRVRR